MGVSYCPEVPGNGASTGGDHCIVMTAILAGVVLSVSLMELINVYNTKICIYTNISHSPS